MTNLERLLAVFPEQADALLISSPQNRFFLTGMHSTDGTCLLFRDAACFIIDSRYHEKALDVVKNFEVILQGKLYTQITELLEKHNATRVAIEEKSVTLDWADTLKKNVDRIVLAENADLSGILQRLRSVKTPEEISWMKTAQEYTDAGFAHICKFIRPGVSEREVALELEFYMRKLGSEGPAFDFITVADPYSSMPHGVPSDHLLEQGQFLTMDFGGISHGYRSDMTRTVAIGPVDGDHLAVYDTVLKAQRAAIDAACPEISGGELDAVARNIIREAGYGEYFGHGLGHSVGLDIHEWPRTAGTEPLGENVVMTVEPGIYLPGRFGVRIEDMIITCKNGCYNFTKSPKELIML